MKEVSAAFVRAQRAFGPALKSHTNPHFRSKYADLSACVEAVIDALNAQGIALVQRTSPSDSGVIVETVFVHESGETMNSGQLHVPAAKNDPQGFGSALTYARRYSLMAACGIAPEDDDGNAATRTAPKAVKLAALDGIGDDLPQEAKEALKDLAAEAIELVNKGQPEQALNTIRAFGAEGDEKIYLDRQLPSNVRSALRKVSQQQKVA